MTNVTGHNYHERQREGRGKGKKKGFGGGVNHFDPASPIFEAKDVKLIVMPDIGLKVVLEVIAFLLRLNRCENCRWKPSRSLIATL